MTGPSPHNTFGLLSRLVTEAVRDYQNNGLLEV